MRTEVAKAALIEFQKQHEEVIQKLNEYNNWKRLPWWKRMLSTKKVALPRKEYDFSTVTLYRDWYTVVELRLYYSSYHKEITIAVNEDNKGFKYDIDSKEIKTLIGSRGTDVSKEVWDIINHYTAILAPLIVE